MCLTHLKIYIFEGKKEEKCKNMPKITLKSDPIILDKI